MADGKEPMTTSTATLTEEEIASFVAAWYRNLDVHAPADAVAAMVTDDVEFQLPEGPFTSVNSFRDWYEGVIRIFFDEIHTVESVEVSWKDQRVLVKVLVNWQARRWSPPAARSQWIGFDVDQDWEVLRSTATGRPVIARYVVNELRLMPGSPPL